MALGDNLNNPGDLTPLNGGALWNGQVAGAGQGGLIAFDTPANGVRAVAIDVRNAITGGASSLSALVAHYLNTPGLQPTAANPNPQGYLSTVSRVSGISPNQTITQSDVPAILQGIFAGEGTTVNPTDFQAGLSAANIQTSSSWIDSIGRFISGADQLGPHNATAQQAAQSIQGGWVGQVFSDQSAIGRLTILLVGGLLLAAAVFSLAKSQGVTVALPVPLK